MDMFPPSLQELSDMGETLYAIYFVKPYDLKSARTFMKLYKFVTHHLVESEDVYIYYQKYSYIPEHSINFDYKLSSEVIWYNLKSIKNIKLLFTNYFNDNLVFITFADPAYSVYVLV